MSAHLMYKMFKFGCIPFAIIDDVIIFIACSTPKSMDILGIYLANLHMRSLSGVWMGNGKSMMRWGYIIVIIFITLGERRESIILIINNVIGESWSIIERKGAG